MVSTKVIFLLLLGFGCAEAQEVVGRRHDGISNRSSEQLSKRSSGLIQVSVENRVAAGLLLDNDVTFQFNQSDPLDSKLSEIFDRDEPDMRPSRDYSEKVNITMDLSRRAWVLLYEQVKGAIGNRINLARPAIDELLLASNVSKGCFDSINYTFEAAKRMESWAVKMMNSWGNFPMPGIFEGTYGDVGSFGACLSIKGARYIDHAHYCSITFKPLMPSRKDYELVVRKEPDLLRNTFENMSKRDNLTHVRDAFTEILEYAQYHHFVYYKLGTCWPIQCNPFDVRKIVRVIGKRNFLQHGPVKCYSKNETDYEESYGKNWESLEHSKEAKPTGDNISAKSSYSKLVISNWNKNDGIYIWKPHFNATQKVAAYILMLLSAFIALMTLIDLLFVRSPILYVKFKLALRGLPMNHTDRNTIRFERCSVEQVADKVTPNTLARVGFSMVSTDANEVNMPDVETVEQLERIEAASWFMSFVDDCSILTNLRQFFLVSQGQLRNDVLCLNGIRCITMVWIIMTHTMMYNDWSEFARTREIEKALKSPMNQPLFNGSYLVDTFFLMSGLLSAFTAFKHCQGLVRKFNSFAFIFGRWLRLTPQIFTISMIYIIFPTLSSGPHWYPIVSEYSENCVNNWWINTLHLQAFYKKEEMCNFVTWWISIDFFYHFLALAVIWIILLTSHKLGFLSMLGIIIAGVVWQVNQHYKFGLPPNILSTVPQTGKMWSQMTLEFFWTPYTHAVPFFFGFYVGYLMSVKRKLILRELNTRRALIGWTLSIVMLIGQAYGTYWWVTGQADYSRTVSTFFYTICSIIWNSSLCWIIIACHHGYGGFINRLLSCKIFIILGKASYLVYLSHFLILFLFFGNSHILIEPTMVTMFYIIVGNIFLSTIFGIFMCAVYELPWLKFHRRLMKYV